MGGVGGGGDNEGGTPWLRSGLIPSLLALRTIFRLSDRERAASGGVTLGIARRNLDDKVKRTDAPTNLAKAIRARFAPLGGVEMELPPREPIHEPPKSDQDGDDDRS